MSCSRRDFSWHQWQKMDTFLLKSLRSLGLTWGELTGEATLYARSSCPARSRSHPFTHRSPSQEIVETHLCLALALLCSLLTLVVFWLLACPLRILQVSHVVSIKQSWSCSHTHCQLVVPSTSLGASPCLMMKLLLLITFLITVTKSQTAII